MTEIEIKDARTQMAMLWLSMNAQKTEAEITAINKKIDELQRKLERSKDEEEKPIKWARCLRFTQKEIAKMPKRYQKFFRTEQVRAIVTLRNDGVFAIRCRKQKDYGINIEVYSKDLEKAKQKFIQKLNNLDKQECKHSNLMTECVEEYLSRNARHVVDSSATHKANIYNNHIKPYIVDLKVKDMTASVCQNLIDRLLDEGKGRTAEEVHSILNSSFKLAIGNGQITKNPLNYIEYEKHKRKNGDRLDNATIGKIMNAKAKNVFDESLKLCILLGVRPIELKSVKMINDNFFEVKNAKQKKGVVTFRKIPTTPVSISVFKRYKKYNKVVNERTLSAYFHENYSDGNTKLYFSRHTFTSLCAESGIMKACIDVWLNHTNGDMTEDVYTHISDDVQYAEMQKFHFPRE